MGGPRLTKVAKMRQIEIEWVQLQCKVTATLHDRVNVRLTDLLWESLPYASIQNHALVSGDHLYHLLPRVELTYTQVDYVVADRTKEPDGTMFMSHLLHLAVKYGELTEYLPAAPIGRVIPEHIGVLKEAGNAMWAEVCGQKRPVEVRVSRKGEAWFETPLPAPRRTHNAAVDDLLAKIHAATESIWMEPSSELLDIHAGRAPSGAGSHGQYFSTMLFVNGEVRPMAYGAFGGLVRAAALGQTDLDSLKRLTPTFLKTTSEFLEYCGLQTLHGLTSELIASMVHVRTVAEYLELVSALCLYANQLNVWNLHYFPWHHGELEYRHPRPANAVSGVNYKQYPVADSMIEGLKQEETGT